MPPRKRTRIAEEDHDTGNMASSVLENEVPVVGLEQDEDFWYEDGNIILTTADVAFKVYRGPLVKHSPVFKDMLSLPQPSSSSHAVACPVIPITDSANDLRHMLRVLMPVENIKSVIRRCTWMHIDEWS